MIQLVQLSFILLIIIDRPVSNTVILGDFQQQALIEHNLKRQLHCTGSMILNSTLNAIAQNYSEYLAANNLFNHSQTPGLGENLWALFSSSAVTFVNGSTPTISWYNEISSYSYSSPGFSLSTGHFTQVIWKNSIQLGIGIAFSNDSHNVTVVANYYPAGNVQGSFSANVLPLCSTSATNNSAVIGSPSYIHMSGMIIIVGSLFNQFSYN